VDAFAGPDDQPGPDSRKAYTLRITNRGAENRARSSAGLDYVVQTGLQRLDEGTGEKFLPEVEIHVWPALAYHGFLMDSHCLAVMGRRSVENKYWHHLQNRMWNVPDGFKDGDTMASIDELRPHT
jgi:hypothetical protein